MGIVGGMLFVNIETPPHVEALYNPYKTLSDQQISWRKSSQNTTLNPETNLSPKTPNPWNLDPYMLNPKANLGLRAWYRGRENRTRAFGVHSKLC